jgi:hypothetical protein
MPATKAPLGMAPGTEPTPAPPALSPGRKLARVSLILGLSWIGMVFLMWASPGRSAVGSESLDSAYLLGGWVLIPALAIAAVVVGRRARKQIARSGSPQTGRGVALAGMLLGWLGISLLVAILALGIYLLANPPL